MRGQRRAQTAARNGGAPPSRYERAESWQMPRGSKPGIKRGGRTRGTPNRRTILADRIFVAAAAHPVAGWQELLSVLMDDQALPADTRLVIAQKPRSAAARSNKARAKTTNAKSAATSSQKQAAVELDSLFRLARNANLTQEERRKAAARMARFCCPRPRPAIPHGRGRSPMNTGLSSARKSPASIATPNCCCRNSRTMNRSDRGALGKPTKLGRA